MTEEKRNAEESDTRSERAREREREEGRAHPGAIKYLASSCKREHERGGRGGGARACTHWWGVVTGRQLHSGLGAHRQC